MLTREDLEKRIDWRPEEILGWKFRFMVMNSSDSRADETLKAAAPKLALACLLAKRWMDTPTMATDDQLIEESKVVHAELCAALAAAGVEVE